MSIMTLQITGSVSTLMKKYPFASNALFAGSCMAWGDWATQNSEAWRRGPTNVLDDDYIPRFDLRRNAAYAAFGACWSVPGVLFYKILARHGPSTATAWGAMKGALIGELCLDLPFSVPVFLVFTDAMRGRDAQFIYEHLKRDYPACAMTSFSMWYPATIINLRFVPIHYRVMFDSAVNVCWGAAFSYLSNKKPISTASELPKLAAD